MTDFEHLLRALHDREVQFIIVGGVAATVHGSARLTQDLDVVYARGDARYRCLDLPWLIRTKRAAGRPRDLEAVAELEALRDESGQP